MRADVRAGVCVCECWRYAKMLRIPDKEAGNGESCHPEKFEGRLFAESFHMCFRLLLTIFRVAGDACGEEGEL